MSPLHEDDDDDLQGPAHREVTLSVSAVLGIFFALALSWALFFAFGYNMGNKSKIAAQSSTPTTDGSEGSTANFGSFKPAPGSPANQGGTPNINTVPINAGSGPVTTVAPVPGAPSTTSSGKTETPNDEDPGPAPVRLPPAIHIPAPQPTPSLNTSVASTGTFVVQIAAISHQEDADLLVGALRAKGYSVTARPEADKLVHIQVGPFNNKPAADAMRQRLLADGYNAIVK